MKQHLAGLFLLAAGLTANAQIKNLSLGAYTGINTATYLAPGKVTSSYRMPLPLEQAGKVLVVPGLQLQWQAKRWLMWGAGLEYMNLDMGNAIWISPLGSIFPSERQTARLQLLSIPVTARLDLLKWFFIGMTAVTDVYAHSDFFEYSKGIRFRYGPGITFGGRRWLGYVQPYAQNALNDFTYEGKALVHGWLLGANYKL